MNIRTKILLSIMAVTAVSALAIGVIAVFNTMSILAIAAILLGFSVIATLIGVYVANSIADPLNTAVDMIHEMSLGHLGFKLNLNRGDEIGAMAEALDTFADTLRLNAGGGVAEIELKDGALRGAAETESPESGVSAFDEVSQSLAEMSSMAKRNMDTTSLARLFVAEASAAARVGDAAMKRMANAVRLIKISSDNNVKIIKMIDYMALRAKLLAFNAAVEAARADETNEGFAVLANEMRNFAQRCARAAKNTADMIEESVREADDAVKVTEDVARSVGKIVNRTGDVGNLVAELAQVSSEQVQSVKKVKAAVARTNSASRCNAASDTPACVDKKPGADQASKQKKNPYKKIFPAASLSFLAPLRVENAEAAFPIDEYESWR
jgi:methyl-accepting chemotaxis protein